ncbi:MULTISPECIES: response regulator [Chelativorans]|jgi:two-component system OmpR family response regulator|nr:MULTISPECIES: response regulator transcription factor [Chelativorans]
MSQSAVLDREFAHPGERALGKRLLIVDDDDDIRTLVAEQLAEAGFRVELAADGVEMFDHLSKKSIDLIILDVNLPGEDGLSLCRRHGQKSNIPVIMLTARGALIDRVIGLEVGADDYLAKPFEPRELLARIRCVLRRAGAAVEPVDARRAKRARFRGWTLDFENRCLVDRAGRVVVLSGNEFSLLKYFVENANEVLTREQLLTLSTPATANDYNAQRLADLQICRLRQKLHPDTDEAPLIATVRNRGYVLAAAVEFE